MGKILVLIFNAMADYEITLIAHLLGTVDPGKEIITIAYEDKTVTSRSGMLYKPRRLVSDVLNEDADGLMLCGGWYGDTRRELIQLINELHAKNKLLAAICGAGTVFLANAGVLKKVKYTTPAVEWTQKHIEVFGEQDPFPRENFVSARVIRDRNIITAQGVAFIDFTIEICDWFSLFTSPEEKQKFAKDIKGL